MDTSLILNRLKSIKKIKTDTDLANFLGISRSTLSNWHKRNSINYNLLFSKCETIDFNYLIKGKKIQKKSQNELNENNLTYGFSEPNTEYKKINQTINFKKEDFIKFVNYIRYYKAVVITDIEGKIKHINNDFTEQTGYNIKDCLQKQPKAILQREGNPIQTGVRKKLDEHQYFYEEIQPNFAKDGTKIICKIHFFPLFSNQNTFNGFVSLADFSAI